MSIETKRRISGTLRSSGPIPLRTGVVELYQKYLRTERPLGRSALDHSACYVIEYSTDSDGTERNLVARALIGDHVVGESAILFHAPEQAVIDLDVDESRLPQSEYKRLIEAIEPVLAGVLFTDLTPDNVKYVSGTTGIAETVIGTFSQAAKLGQSARLPTSFLYALGRQNIGLKPEKMALATPDQLRSAAELSLRRHIIDQVDLTTSLEDLISRWERWQAQQSVTTYRQIKGKLRAQEGILPLAGYTVEVTDLLSGGTLEGRAYGVSSSSGSFSFRLAIRQTAQQLSQRPPTLQLSLKILDSSQRDFVTQEVEIDDRGTALDLRIPLPGLLHQPLTVVFGALHLGITESTLQEFAAQNVHTLADLRRAGGTKTITLPNSLPEDQAKAIDAHTQLAIISSDLQLNAELLKAGYWSIPAIARRSRTQFGRSLPGVDPSVANKIHNVATAQNAVLSNLIASALAARASGYRSFSSDSNLMEDVALSVCSCQDCESATSPLAYLADLTAYAIQHVVDGTSPLTLDSLVQLLRQPLDQLPVSCGSVDARVHQVRLCIEVLRSYLSDHPPASGNGFLVNADGDYLLRSYQSLLTRLGTSFDELESVRFSNVGPVKQQQLRGDIANRLGMLASRVDALILEGSVVGFPSGSPGTAPQIVSQLSEDALQKIFGLASTHARSLDGLTSESDLESWRREYLRLTWQEQDHPSNPYIGLPDLSTPGAALPVIDPDLIGPDDLRLSLDANQRPIFDQQSAFQLWLKRRQAVDQFLTNLSVSRDLAMQAGGNVFGALLGLTFASPPADWDQLWNILRRNNALQRAGAQGEIASLHLSIPAFERLMAVRNLDRNATTRAQISPTDWEDVDSILTQSWKAAQVDAWCLEEQGLKIKLGADLFWSALSEPSAGQWPPHLDASRPLIDPDLIRFADLPDATVGAVAQQLWRARRQEIDELEQNLQQTYTQAGLPAVLAASVGIELSELDRLAADLNGSDLQKARQATNFVENTLEMSVPDFSILRGLELASQPSSSEIADAVAVLAAAKKRKVLYRLWQQQEAFTGLSSAKYWLSRKAKLPLWRAGIEARQVWRRALESTNASPLIDPDLLDPSYFNTLDPPSPAFTLWKSRKNWIDNEILGFKLSAAGAAANLGSWMDQTFATILGVAESALAALSAERDEGNDISGRLSQLSLTEPALDRLLQIRSLVPQGQLLASDWSDLTSILLQVEKLRGRHGWLEDERKAAIILCGDEFEIPLASENAFASSSSVALPPWRANISDLSAWRQLLTSRIDEDEAVSSDLADLVSSVEEETLPPLRDALLTALALPDTTTDRATWVTENLLIDAAESGVQVTTRVSQVIESLQQLLWGLRTGLVLPDLPNLQLVADSFDEEWKWLGSYSTWQAALNVFLYPEEVLTPTLRRIQTSKFTDAAKQIVFSGSSFDPVTAQKIVADYQRYLLEISKIDVQATCGATTHVKDSSGGNSNDVLLKTFLFGTSRSSGTLYWTAYDPKDEDSKARACWQAISGVSDALTISGAVPYSKGIPVPVGDEPPLSIFVFYTGHENGVDFAKAISLDIDSGQWETPIDLQLPLPKLTKFVCVQQSDATLVPMFIAQHVFDDAPSESPLYLNSLDVFGRGLQNSAWTLIKTTYDYNGPEGLDQLLTQEGGALVIAAASRNQNNSTLNVFFKNNKWVYAGLYDSNLNLIRISLNRLGSEDTWCGALCILGTTIAFYVAWAATPPTTLYTIYNGYGISMADRPPLAQQLGPMATSSLSAGWDALPTIVFRDHNHQLALFQLAFDVNTTSLLVEQSPVSLTIPAPLLSLGMLPTKSPKLDIYAGQVQSAYVAGQDRFPAIVTYVEELCFFLPVLVALQLAQSTNYDVALDWWRIIYNFDASANSGNRKIYYGLVAEESEANDFQRAANWLLDPLNPHSIAETRRNAYTRFTLLSVVRCLLDYGDSEFTRDTSESVPRARTLYLRALDLLHAEWSFSGQSCNDLIVPLESELPTYTNSVALRKRLLTGIAKLNKRAEFKTIVENVTSVLRAETATDPEQRLVAALALVENRSRTEIPSITLSNLINRGEQDRANMSNALLRHPEVTELAFGVTYGVLDTSYATLRTELPESYIPATRSSFAFCVPPDPTPSALRSRAQLNLYKIRTGRNVAGEFRELQPYVVADQANDLTRLMGLGGTLPLPQLATFTPTAYRYDVLIDRAKQLVQLAAQIEASMLSAIEKAENEEYNVLKARQDLQVARAGVELQNLRVKSAWDGVDLAISQQDKAQDQTDHYGSLLSAGLTQNEQDALDDLGHAADLQSLAVDFAAVGAATSFVSGAASGAAEGAAAGALLGPAGIVGGAVIGGLFGGASSSASSLSTWASTRAAEASTRATIASTRASYERREQEWKFQKAQAEADINIAGQQITVAQDQVRISGQELAIAQIQVSNAQQTIDFLNNKFTNADLYYWMSGILQGVYSYFLRQATTMASLARNQLAFERQENPPHFIQADYWVAPTTDILTSSSDTPDRKGLTGSARLLQDIYQLDEYAFDTDARKLQLSKTISLSSLDPYAFARFRDTGLLRFVSPSSLFDRDFPGHYLRLISRVSTSVVALIPPNDGIHGVLTSNGLSRVVTFGTSAKTTIVKRNPESVALSAAVNATGVFALNGQSKMLNPFESMGVDTSWELSLPKAANRFDYQTIADVLFTIDYTALSSLDYRNIMIRSLGQTTSADQPYSFRLQFPDQWYDLNNPQQSQIPMTVEFEIAREDFPPNLDRLRIEQLLLFFDRSDALLHEIRVDSANFQNSDGGAVVTGTATSMDGVISTRRGNGSSWTPLLGLDPVGTWRLSLRNDAETRNWFTQGLIQDVLLVITYSAETPTW